MKKSLRTLSLILVLALAMAPVSVLASEEPEDDEAFCVIAETERTELEQTEASEPADGSSAEEADEPTEASERADESSGEEADEPAEASEEASEEALETPALDGESDRSGALGSNLTWVLSTDGVLTISGKGAMKNYSWKFSTASDATPPWSKLEDEIRAIVIGSGVTTIGSYIFSGCQNLESVTMSDTVTRVGEGAFTSCSALRSVRLSQNCRRIGGGAFYNCSALESLSLPESLEAIEIWAFSGTGLRSVTFSGAVTELGTGSFMDVTYEQSSPMRYTFLNLARFPFEHCASLTEINVIGYGTYYSMDGVLYGRCPVSNGIDLLVYPMGRTGEFAVPEGTNEIAMYAFKDCAGLTSVLFPDDCHMIGLGAFQSCSNLETVTFSNSMVRALTAAFKDCDSLTTLNYYGTRAQLAEFEWYTENDALRDAMRNYLGERRTFTVTIEGNGGVMEGGRATRSTMEMQEGTSYNDYYIIGTLGLRRPGYSFDGFYTAAVGGEPIPMTSGVTDATLYAHWIRHSASGVCGDALTWTLHESVLTISGTGDMWDFDFDEGTYDYPYLSTTASWSSYVEEITTLVVEKGVKSIGSCALRSFYNLSSVSLPEGLERIGNSAFMECSVLEQIKLPGSLRTIEQYAFCMSGLKSIVLPHGITEIAPWTFVACWDLEKATIPYSVRSIGEGAFIAADELKEIDYYGTESDWKAIDITYTDGRDGEVLRSVRVNYLGRAGGTVGDANGDGYVTVSDAAAILAGGTANGADASRDGRVNAYDAALVLRYAVGRVPAL